MAAQTDRTALSDALRTILSDFDREPDDEYMAVAVPMFLSLLPADWCGHDRVIEAYKQAIRDLGSSPDAQANIAVQLLQAEIARLREALERIDSLPAGYYRKNGFASPDPWVRQRDVRRILRAALEEKP